MMTYTTFFIIQGSIILVGIIAIIIRNIFIKNKKLSSIIASQDKYLMELYNTIKLSEQRIKEIDEKQIFQGDDEIGWFFTNLKKMQEALSEYIDLVSTK